MYCINIKYWGIRVGPTKISWWVLGLGHVFEPMEVLGSGCVLKPMRFFWAYLGFFLSILFGSSVALKFFGIKS
jgi:hypothetical protein